MSAQRRVLLVDDDPLILRTASRWLRRRDFDVATASTGEGALATSGPFVCAVFDLELPDGSGVDYAKRMLASGTAKSVVFFSGTSNPALLRDAEAVGWLVSKGAGIGELALAIADAAIATQPSGFRAVGGLKVIAGAKD
jgi:ActR/RegA family two-component response regulator